MSKYIDNVVLKLKRKYSKDELVAWMIKEHKELQIELEKVKSEKDELHDQFNRILKLDDDTKNRLSQIRYIRNFKNELTVLRVKCNRLKLENTKLFSDLARHNAQHNRTSLKLETNNDTE
jgi:hypothetical protein